VSTDGALHVAVIAACPFPEPRGTPVRILRLSQATARLGHRVSVLTYHFGAGEDPEGLEVRRIPDVPSYSKTGPGPSIPKLTRLDPALTRLLREFLAKEQIDVIHAHHYEGLLVAAAAARGTVPIVYDAHTMLSTELPEYRFPVPKGVLGGIGEWLDRRIPKRADHIVAVTDTIRHKLVSLGFEPDRITVASQGVEDEFFTGPSTANEAAGGASPTIVFAGNLAAYQGIDSLLESFAVVRRARPDARLSILSGSDFDAYEEHSKALGIRDAIEIEAVALSDLPARLEKAAVTVNPRTDCDGIPIKLLNYMATSRPIVSYAGSFPIRGDEPLAVLVPDGDADAFGDAIVALLDDPARAARLGQAGRRYAEAHHRWGTIAERVDGIYRRLVAGRRAGGDG
jgi:glycosyltransferase involved in cell wall biosynthesis